MAASYIVQEEDGTSKFTLEEDGGSLVQEESVPGPNLIVVETSTQWLLWGH